MKISTKVWDKRFKKEGKVFEEPHEDIPGNLDEFFVGFSISDIHLDSTGHYCVSGFKR